MKTTSISLAAAALLSGPLAFAQSEREPGDYVYEDEANRYGFRVTSKPTYPSSLAREGIDKGQAMIVFEVSPEGKLTQLLPIHATHEAFAERAAEAMRRWEYAPPRIEGEPVYLAQKVRFDFESSGGLYYSTSREFASNYLHSAASDNLLDGAIALTPASKLDRPLNPIETPKPAWDPNWLGGREQVEIVFSFYVDRSGQVKLPTVAQAPSDVDPRFVEQSVRAFQQWRFDPPRRSGRATIARASQPIVFRRP